MVTPGTSVVADIFQVLSDRQLGCSPAPRGAPEPPSATVHSASSRPDLEAVERLHPGRGLEGSLPRRAGSDAWTPHGGFPVIGGQADRGWSFLNAWLGKKTRG